MCVGPWQSTHIKAIKTISDTFVRITIRWRPRVSFGIQLFGCCVLNTNLSVTQYRWKICENSYAVQMHSFHYYYRRACVYVWINLDLQGIGGSFRNPNTSPSLFHRFHGSSWITVGGSEQLCWKTEIFLLKLISGAIPKYWIKLPKTGCPTVPMFHNIVTNPFMFDYKKLMRHFAILFAPIHEWMREFAERILRDYTIMTTGLVGGWNFPHIL